MAELCRVGPAAVERLKSLGLSHGDMAFALDAAAADARMCTDLDSPGAFGYTLWTRSNRYFRERKSSDAWGYSNRDHILRTIHPSGDFAITAISGSGGVGRVGEKVQAKNPKGTAVADVIEVNGQMSFPFPEISPQEAERPSEDLPTWFLLYSWSEFGISSELSFPVGMHGKLVNTWSERIMNPFMPTDPPGIDISTLDAPDDDEGPDVSVEFKR